MNPNFAHLIDPGALAQARAHAHTSLNRNPYYTAQSALLASRVVEVWKREGWCMQNLNASILTIAPRTLREKLKSGIEWNIANSTGAEAEFWRTVRATIKFSIKGDILTLYKTEDVTAAMSNAAPKIDADIRAEFINWASRALPGKTFHRPGLTLDDDTVKWFKDKLNEPKWTDAFVGYARNNEVRIVRTTAIIEGKLSTATTTED